MINYFEPQLIVKEINTSVGKWIKITKLNGLSCLRSSIEHMMKLSNSYSDFNNGVSSEYVKDTQEQVCKTTYEYLYIGSIGSVSTIEPQCTKSGVEKELFTAYGLIGVWRYDKNITKCLFVTDAEFVTEIGYGEKIYKINKVRFVDLDTKIQTESSKICNKETKNEEDQLEDNLDSKIESANIAESMILSVFKRGGFYFSTCSRTDITKSVRQSIINGNRSGDLPEERFCWNYNLLLPLYEGGSNTSRWASPIISGFVGSSRFTFGQSEENNDCNEINFLLISRRDYRRQGVRYLCRGANTDGNTSNSVETEQIIIVRNQNSTRILSYLQYRGSIPIIWKQNPNLEKTPPVQIYSNHECQQIIVNRHFNELMRKYCNFLNDTEDNYFSIDNKKNMNLGGAGILVVNLIDKKRHELVLGAEFEKHINNIDVNNVQGSDIPLLGDSYSNNVSKNGKMLNDVRFCWFDFHHECSKMRWKNLSLLISDLVKIGLDDIGLTSLEIQLDSQKSDYSPIYGIIQGNYNASSEIEFKLIVNSIQNGICRTNCIDCLDRTNVVQSVLGRRVLLNTLKQMNCIDNPSSRTSEITSVFEDIPGRDFSNEFNFRKIWSDNADALSKLYSGTPAQKTDFTRYGRRTKKGALLDSIYSIIRFMLNSLVDGYTQDAYFVFTNQCSYPNSDLGIKKNMQDKLIMNKYKYLSSPIVFAIGQYLTLVTILLFLPLFQVIVSYSKIFGGNAICIVKDFIYLPSKLLFYLIENDSEYKHDYSIVNIIHLLGNYLFRRDKCYIYPIGSLITTTIVLIIGLILFIKHQGSKVATKPLIDNTNCNFWEEN